MHEIGISANKIYVCVCVCVRACGDRSSGGEGVLRREEERAGRNEDKGVASTPRGPVGASTISSTHVPLRYAYARAYVKDAREAGAAAAFYPVPVQTAKEFHVPPSDMSPPGFQREPQPFLPPSLRLLPPLLLL